MSDSQIPATASVPRVQRAQGDGDKLAGRGEQDRAVERFRWRVGRPADRVDAEVDGELPVVLSAGQDVHPKTQVQGDLRREVRAAAEAVDAQRAAGGHGRRRAGPIADDAGAEQGSGLLVVERRRAAGRRTVRRPGSCRRSRRRRPTR